MALMYKHGKLGQKKPEFIAYLIIFLIVIMLVSLGYYIINKKGPDMAPDDNELINLLPNEPQLALKKETEDIVVQIETYLSTQKGTYGYSVLELDDGRSFGKRESTYYTAASTVKVAIATYVYDQIKTGKVSADKLLTYTGADYEQGTGSIQHEKLGTKYKISYLLERMIVVSDNVATNILMRYFGRSNIQNFLDKNGLTECKVSTNDVTPRSMTKLLSLIYNEKLIPSSSKNQLLSYMKKSITETRLVAGVPKEIEVAHKIGSWSGAISDVGIVFTENREYAIAVYSEGVAWGEATDNVIAQISKMIYDFETSF